MTANQHLSNKLVQEKSPYLLQHAHNPVDWYPWNPEAFSRAVAEDKPVFLSIGYSTCHWCHVMERESFEDEEVARILNRDFIAIKVDREERPDIDHIYMEVCQALTGSGGWPLTIIMTPDKKPFYAATYLPKRGKPGYEGLVELLENISDAWKNDQQALLDSSVKITNHVFNNAEGAKPGTLDMNVVNKAFADYAKSFDQVYGGFGTAPKFPTPHSLTFLLRYYKSTGNGDALKIVEKTLESMYRGGIYDHIGFGFSRYSTDRKWLVPHFEKMLYDNALLADAYLEAFQVTGRALYRNAAAEIFEYVLRDMTSTEGGFYSAEDADSEGVEGKFYVWTREEVTEVLGEEDAGQFCLYYDITKTGNFEDNHNIPNLIGNRVDLNEETAAQIETLRKKMFEYRVKRVHPYKDDKILTAWNGLMIAALSKGYRVLGNKACLDAARKAVDFINQKLRRHDGRLLARYRDGDAAHLAYLDDYAFYVWGLIELYEASFEPRYLKLAVELNRDMIKYFGDDEGGFFLYGSDAEQLITRPKEVYDGAMPSGNSVAASNLLRLARLTGDGDLEDMAALQLETFAGAISQYPTGYAFMLQSVLFIYAKSSEVVLVGSREAEEIKHMIQRINQSFLPYSVFLLNDPNMTRRELVELVPFITEQQMREGKGTAYICENHACREPIVELQQFMDVLGVNKYQPQ